MHSLKVEAFLGHYGFPVHGPDINSVINGLLYDMQESLDNGSGTGSLSGIQAMIPVWSRPPEKIPENKKAIVIDAGGTNFRSCLVSFDSAGQPVISDPQKTAMPAIDREYSKEDFFDTMAENLEHLKDRAPVIGFCFSYAMQILPDGDATVLEFSKEIKAKEVIGSLVGDSLADALVARGWKRPEKITVLNDTTAALCAGTVVARSGHLYDSYTGFILGTGMNSAYIESEPIRKIIDGSRPLPSSQIVVCEVGSYDGLPKSVFDEELDALSITPGRFVMEKMCAGAYLGTVASIAVRHACADGLFSENFAQAFGSVGRFELADMDRFLYTPYDRTTKLGAIVASGSPDDYDMLYLILDAFIERSARLAAAAIAATVIKSGKGRRPTSPVCVVCNGTTFNRTHNLKPRISAFLEHVLSRERQLYFEIVSIDNDITLGTAAAAVQQRNVR